MQQIFKEIFKYTALVGQNAPTTTRLRPGKLTRIRANLQGGRVNTQKNTKHEPLYPSAYLDIVLPTTTNSSPLKPSAELSIL